MTLTSAMLAIPAGLAAAGGAGLLAHGVVHPRSELYCPLVARLPDGAGACVALTFDDGPFPGGTDRVLDILKSHGASATFFVIGRYALTHPSLLRRIVEEGHAIGNHTFDHHRAGTLRGTSYWLDQVRRTDDKIANITGAAPRLFRAPMGLKSPSLGRAIRKTGHVVVAWSLRALDGVATTPERIEARLGPARGGDILLLHDGRDLANKRGLEPTIAALPRVLGRLRERGLSTVRLDEALLREEKVGSGRAG